MVTINRAYYKGIDLYTEGHDVEDDIYKYILETPNRNYDNILKNDKRWTVFYHLSDIRKGSICWYDFKKDSSVLEVGGGMGALTGVLCDKCKEVTTIELSDRRAKAIKERYKDKDNLEIYVGNVQDIKLEKKFDYITLIGVLEYQGNYSDSNNPYADFLKCLKGLLKDDGKLLIAIENRFGLKYWCGSAEDHIGKPFSGINGYSENDIARTFSKKELEKIILEAGFENKKFYYPLPDYKFPTVVYSERFLPKDKINTKCIPYYIDKKSIIASEINLYKDIIENNVFEFFANSFFVECSIDGVGSDVKFATITANRANGNKFCTCIKEDNNVYKIPLDKERQDVLLTIDSNTINLKKRNIKVVHGNISDGQLVMPYMSLKTLEEVLSEKAKENKEDFLQLIKDYWKLVLSSSEKSINLNIKFKDINKENLGDILKYGYLDLIFNNCFVENNEIVVFDQEFIEEDIPAKFILFRALKNLYFFDKEIEKYISIEELKDLFELNEYWLDFEKIDCENLNELMKNDVNSIYYQWSLFENEIIETNCKFIQKDNSIKKFMCAGNKFKDYSTVMKLWIKDEDNLDKVNKYFEMNDIRSVAIYGYGDMGRVLEYILDKTFVKIKYIIDRNADNIESKKDICKVEDIKDDIDMVIVTALNDFENIKRTLEKKNICNVESMDSWVEKILI